MRVSIRIKVGRKRRRVVGCGTVMVHDGGCPVTCTKGTGSTTRCAVLVNSLLLITVLLILDISRTTGSTAKAESSGATSLVLIIVVAWASSTRVAGSVAMKVVIRTISLTVKVTLFASTVDPTRANGVKVNGAVLEDRF